MFVGSINQDLRALVSEVTRSWETDEIYIGCSGNFTIERILKDRGLDLYGNDVSIYTCTIGNYLAGLKEEMTVQAEAYKWLEPYMEPGPNRIATLLLCTSMLDGYHRNEPFFQRRRKAYKDQWERLHAETVEKVKKGIDNLKMAGFWPGDCVEWAQMAPNDAGFISFPPTYTGGYEKLYSALMEVFAWQEPEYAMFDKERLAVMVDAVKEKRFWMMARDEPIPGLEGYEVGKIQTSLRSKPLTVYANKAPKRITMPRQNTELLKVPRFTEKDVIREDSRLSVTKISQAQMNTLRSLYLNPGIAPASAGLNLGVLIDGKLIGAIGLSKSNYGTNEAYLMSDFVIRPVKYKRLSKLILATVISKEVKLLIEQAFNQRMRHVSTTAFTEKPVSMKYRGIFHLESRKKDPPRLNYGSDTGRWTLEEAMNWWKQKHMKEIV
ncbi:hypothetical protein COJ96_10825 [Bacillus sp. AFS073361]|uniref:putative antirestriction adenine methyltransferase n=1 Tax=Bacillus sp. AFS073361 TaxID=2033511 RepID=UPI000BF366A7|nr:hypothetical protein [Bacillus sp. AFS073361]PFP29389.1 hypothetical protein COJ96_10825 [Bacillus sp. AFS073361]